MRKTEVELESRVVRGAHGVASEEDHIQTAKIIRISLIGLSIFIAGGLWAWRIQVSTTRKLMLERPAPIPAPVGQYEIGIVNQRLFTQDTHAREKLGAQEQALVNGWAEQPGVVAHPTISQAMDQIIQEQAAQRRQQQQQQAPESPTPEPR